MASWEAVASMVSKVARLRCSAEDEIDVPKPTIKATEAKPSTTMAISISSSVSPASDPRRHSGVLDRRFLLAAGCA